MVVGKHAEGVVIAADAPIAGGEEGDVDGAAGVAEVEIAGFGPNVLTVGARSSGKASECSGAIGGENNGWGVEGLGGGPGGEWVGEGLRFRAAAGVEGDGAGIA